jgi:hypothetical protein
MANENDQGPVALTANRALARCFVVAGTGSCDLWVMTVKARGHFPTEQAAMKCLYLVTRSLDPKGTGHTRWATRWKPALNAFAITFADRMPTKTN